MIVFRDNGPNMLGEFETHAHPSETAVPTTKVSVNATGWCDEGAARKRSMGSIFASVFGVAFSWSIEWW